jgi:hypothetical protein
MVAIPNPGLWRIIFVGLLPAVVVALSMFVGHNIFIAMFVMHWSSMIPVPLALTYFIHGKAEIRWYIEYVKQQKFLSDWRICLMLLTVGTLVPVLGYMADSCKTAQWHFCVGAVDDNLAQYGFKDAPKALIIACAVYFPIVNPIIEELFWRVYMDREYTFSACLATREGAEDESLHLMENGASMDNNSDTILPTKSTKSNEIPLYVKLIFSSLYSSYHTMVVGVFLGGVQYGILAFFGIGALGLLFQYIFSVSDNRSGFGRAVCFHVGIDAGVVIALGDAVGWYSILPS